MKGDYNAVSVFLLSDGYLHEMYKKIEKIVDAAVLAAGGTTRTMSRFGEASGAELVQQRISEGNPFELVVLPIPNDIMLHEQARLARLVEVGKQGEGTCIVAVISESVKQSSVVELEKRGCKIFRLSNDGSASDLTEFVGKWFSGRIGKNVTRNDASGQVDGLLSDARFFTRPRAMVSEFGANRVKPYYRERRVGPGQRAVV
ncbi:MAG: hypothetical protein V1909_06900 [Candidatus Micrarchaeota archaeon]